jgi:uncharacterized protein YyaL (SSP411 family)
MPNQLINATSPYLLQHAHNPVDWYTWSDEAFEKAKQEQKPVLVSIGYAACHWCHVMERESFENDTVAAFMNAHFINIKVDREEHPDVDHLYMDALQAMTGAGGWPLNMFVTPDRKPFYGGTYFPPQALYGRNSWMEVLQAIKDTWHLKPEAVTLQSEQMIKHLTQASWVSLVPLAEHQYALEDAHAIAKQILLQADDINGGFGNAPKFPACGSIQYLLEYAYFFKQHSPQSLSAQDHALHSLRAMIHGGIYDQIGGGFSRYTTDSQWLVPHFEKMLYDNALLLSLCSKAYIFNGEKLWKETILQTLQYCDREFRMEDSTLYYCALDADSEGIEGKYYTWSASEMKTILGNDYAIVAAYYGVTNEGNWEHTNILHQAQSAEIIMQQFAISATALETLVKEAKAKLFQERNKRVRPLTDHKILLAWNALMNTALVDVGLALKAENILAQARQHMQELLSKFKNEVSGLYHVYTNGQARIHAKLDDYAYLIKALCHLGANTGEISFLLDARFWLEYVNEHFLSEDGTFYYYSSVIQQDIVVRKIEQYDGATPSANAIMMEILYTLGYYFEHNEWMQQSESMLMAMKGNVLRYPTSYSHWAIGLQRHIIGMKHVVIAGEAVKADFQQLSAQFTPHIHQVLLMHNEMDVPALRYKYPTTQKALYYYCEQWKCEKPDTRLEAILSKIDILKKE